MDGDPIRWNSFYFADCNGDANAVEYNVSVGERRGCYCREGRHRKREGRLEQCGDCHFWPPHHALIFTIDCIRSAGN